MKSATTQLIRATSRASVKIGDNFYTVEYSEERLVPTGIQEKDLVKERRKLWDTVNSECDKQIEDILKATKKSKRH